MKQHKIKIIIVLLACMFTVPLIVHGATQPPSPEQQGDNAQDTILITGANIFDGESSELINGMDVLIEDNKITQIGSNITAPEGALTIDAGGATMIPGLIDVHWHSLMASLPQALVLQSDMGYLNIAAAQSNREALLRGFTTVRDVGGNVFGLKRATDQGIVDGPRIYPSGAYISQTSGHGDFRGPNDTPLDPGAPLDYFQRNAMTLIADGVPEVTKRTREVLRMGASQVKVMAGGGVSSVYDPLDVTQYTFDEMKAIVDVAKTWNTYVAIHANTDDAIQQAIEAGVKCVEHGFLMSEETVQMMADNDVWLSMEPILNDEDAIPFEPGSVQQDKFIQVTDGTDKIINLAKQYGVKIAFGTDTLFDPELAAKQGKQLAKLQRWFTPYETLKMATYDNAQLLKLSGPRDPYPDELGVVKEGAYADLILVDGNPLENLDLIANPDENFVLIMKDGNIYKNTLQ